jgi:misacylated tRNA(Ala) deacylase
VTEPELPSVTEQAYLDDATVRTFTAQVTRRLDDRLVLDRTHFYPEGGGQPADRGRLRVADDERTYRVVDVQKRDTVYHHLEPQDGADLPAEGTAVECELDWERRHALMRYHTAQHLLSALLLDEFDARTTGNQLYADRARIDCEYDRFTDEDREHVANRMNELVDDALPVRWYEMDREAAERELDTDRTRIDLLPDSIRELRIVEVGGDGPAGPTDSDRAAADPYDRTACAGTHVTSTGELGTATVTGRETKGSGEERLSFRLE